MAVATYSAEHIEELLKCSICLDRYIQPKLLPCQHTFCASPCLEGLIRAGSYTTIIKCPECRADHFVPTGGVNAFPNNLTISGFLDLQQQVTVPDPVVSASHVISPRDDGREKCAICDWDSDLICCLHCDKNICDGCHQSHSRQLKLDVGRQIGQLRRRVPVISDAIGDIEQSAEQIRTSVAAAKNEVTATVERHVKELLDREKRLKDEIEIFAQSEQRSLSIRQENLEVELASIASFCDSLDNTVQRSIPDLELINIRQQCSQYMEQVDAIENTQNPSSKLIKFKTEGEVELMRAVHDFGELQILVGSQITELDTGRGSFSLSPRVGSLAQTDALRRMSLPNTTSSYSTYSNTVSTAVSATEGASTSHTRSNTVSRNLNRGGATGRPSPPRRSPPRSTAASSTSTTTGRYSNHYSALRDYHCATYPETFPPRQSTYQYRTRRGGGAVRQIPGSVFDSSYPSGQNETETTATRGSASNENQPGTSRRTSQEEYDERPVGVTRADPVDLTNQQDDGTVGSRSIMRQVSDDSEIVNIRRRYGRERGAGYLRYSLSVPEQTEMTSSSSDEWPTVGNAETNQAESSIPESNNNISFRLSQGDSLTVVQPANNYVAKVTARKVIGKRGNEPGRFTWPRGCCVYPDSDTIVVADSSNHRVQVFDKQGRFLQSFGSYGTNHGEFDCLAGVAVSGLGQIITSDRYNQRIQIFDRHGTFMSKFGCEGSDDGQFCYPWGICCDSLGFIYVCDKENHRIQVFQLDGRFVRKFGQHGQEDGEFENPHYITCSPDNKIVVSDSGNNRVQIFDVRGNHLVTFGVEGSGPDQLKYPRGVVVDAQGFVLVADSGNNRIQVFRQNGDHVGSFGVWGTKAGQLKGIEGIALLSDGGVVVCDRENHRVQIF